jgi:hypothetical protein
VTVTLTADGSSTVGSVNTELSITGKPAQFGRGLISEVGGKILDSFATCLASKLAPPAAPPKLTVVEEPATEPAAATAAAEPVAPVTTQPADAMVATETEQHTEARETGKQAGEATAAHVLAAKSKLAAAPEQETEPIDLLAYAGPSVMKRAAPLLALVAAVLAFIALRRRH